MTEAGGREGGAMRVEGRGLVDRRDIRRFRFDGVEMFGCGGDTLASALLANGVRLVGRSFKYHRPRGIMAAGEEEPNALVTVGTGDRAVPNARATTLELVDGLDARSQNAWPSLALDIRSLADFASPFLGAGFYYKTFMWPRRFWESVYEPAIRRAAGLGALTGREGPQVHERAFAFCDVLVIGAGPAGLMAALEAGRGGADVILADSGFRMGGRLLAETGEVGGKPGSAWAGDAVAELSEMPNVHLMPRTTVTGAYDGGTFAALEEPGIPGAPESCFWRVVARRSVLAAGALERSVAFANNDRPGVMLAGAARAYLNRWGVAPGRAVAVFGNNDDVYLTARDLRAAGVEVAAAIDCRNAAPPPSLAGGLDGVRLIPNGVVCDVAGTARRGVSRVTVRTGSGEERIAADCLAVAGGWNPAIHLTCHLGARPDWRDDLLAFVPPGDAAPGMEAAGACAGDYSTAGALAGGRAAAGRALEALGMRVPGTDLPETGPDESECGAYRIEPLWTVPGRGRAWLDFQNDVTVKDVRQAAAEGFRSVEHMKRYTTQGMTVDQGKVSNVTAIAALAEATGRSIPETGTTTFRPPYVPVPIAAMGAGARGKGFAPQRHSSAHAAIESRGAPFLEAGLWYRPSHFPRDGETDWRDSMDREVRMTREAVGVADVSTLGKIDVQGPDAARFLDFVYANTISTLGTGRVRYGLMLREDGHVMDDGTAARLGDSHFLVTTTTAAAGQVMRHLDFVRQALRPDWDVALASVTEQWAQFSVAGPAAWETLRHIGVVDAVSGAPVAPERWPFMSCGPVRVALAGEGPEPESVDGRLFRISFSGETGAELAVPAGRGEAVFEALASAAEDAGGGVYGMEALNVLRIEKGFVTHAEIHGRATAHDIGMGRMVATGKDCVGGFMSRREGLVDPGRERLVGLEAVEPAGASSSSSSSSSSTTPELTAGAHLFPERGEVSPATDQGYVTSAANSPTLGRSIALAFVRRGPERLGERLRMIDRMRGVEVTCVIRDPVFVDPDGLRARGGAPSPIAGRTVASPSDRRRTPCEGLLPFAAGGVSLSEVAPGSMTLMTPRWGAENALSAALSEAHGVPLPEPTAMTETGAADGSAGPRAIWFGLGQTMLCGPAPAPELAEHAALADQSDAWAVMRIECDEGREGAAELALARLVPVDLRPHAFEPGRAIRTDAGHMPVGIARLTRRAMWIFGYRSMARSLVGELREAMENVAARASG